MGRHKIFSWLRWGAFVAASLLALALVMPHLVSAYHLEVGGRALDNVLDDVLDELDILPHNAPVALVHLQKAIAWEPDNAQAYRLLGQVYQMQGDWLAAIEVLTRYTELRPDNPLGHIELAEVYEAVEAEMVAMHFADLIVALPQAAVQVPDAPLDTPYAQPDGPPWHSYVAATTFGLPPRFGERPTLFMHSTAWVTYTLALPVQPMVLRFGMGMDLQVHGWPGDGVTFEVFVDGERIFLEHVDKIMARQGWHERSVDLAAWAGQEVALTLAVTPGPVADPAGDWAGWGEPQVVDARLPALEPLHPDARVVEEWQRAGLTAESCVDAGKTAQNAGRDEEAVVWYERAIRLKPEWREPYRLLAGTSSGDAMALAYLEAGEREALEKVRWLRPGDLYANYHLWKEAQQSGNLTSAAVYSETLTYFSLKAIHPTEERLLDYAAEVIPILLDKGFWDRDKMLSVIFFLIRQHPEAPGVERLIERLVERYPTEPDWPFCLAELYRHRGNVEWAEATYRQVLEVAPNYAPAYLGLGKMVEADPSSRKGLREAARWYEQYYQVMPDDLLGLKRLAQVCAALEESGLEEESCHWAAKRVMEGLENEEKVLNSPAKVLWTGWLERVATATPDHFVGQELDNGWTFLGYDMDEKRLIRGEPVDLMLYWVGPVSASVGAEENGWYRSGERWAQVLEGVQNLVLNGNFELGMEDGAPTGWPHDVYGTDLSTRRLVTDSRVGQHTTVLLLDNSQVYSSTGVASMHVPVDPDTLYLQAGWIKSVGGNGYLGRYWMGDIAREVYPYNYVATGVRKEDWQHYAGVTRPLEGTTHCKIWLLNFKATGRVYFDNVLFVEIGLPER